MQLWVKWSSGDGSLLGWEGFYGRSVTGRQWEKCLVVWGWEALTLGGVLRLFLAVFEEGVKDCIRKDALTVI
jgi:hypothetical protein